MRFTRAIVRLPSTNFSAGIASAIGGGNPDVALALEQHERYCNALGAYGLRVTNLPGDVRHPDSTFIEDTAILTRRAAIITRPGAPSRMEETAATLTALRDYFETIYTIAAPGTVDGGDVCEVDGEFVIGLSKRTNEEGVGQLTAYLRKLGYKSVVIDIRECQALLHLKSGMSYLGDGVFVINPDTPFASVLERYQLITVAPEESYTANCLRINDDIIVPAGFPKIIEALSTRDFQVHTLAMSEFRKMDGGLSCLSLRF